MIVGFSVFVVLILILAVEVGQILSLTLIINVDVGSNLIGAPLRLPHPYAFVQSGKRYFVEYINR